MTEDVLRTREGTFGRAIFFFERNTWQHTKRQRFLTNVCSIQKLKAERCSKLGGMILAVFRRKGACRPGKGWRSYGNFLVSVRAVISLQLPLHHVLHESPRGGGAVAQICCFWPTANDTDPWHLTLQGGGI